MKKWKKKMKKKTGKENEKKWEMEMKKNNKIIKDKINVERENKKSKRKTQTKKIQ